MKLTSFQIGMCYSSVYIIDRGRPPFDHQDFFDENVYTPEYSCLPSGVAIFSIHDVGSWDTDVLLNEPLQLAVDAIRAIQVSFTVTGDQGVFVGSDVEDYIIDIPAGNYALIAEQDFIGQPPGDIETGETRMWCKLWFNQTKKNIEPKI
jgi:hypothetical protein